MATVTSNVSVILSVNEVGSADLGTPTITHRFGPVSQDLVSGTTDNKADLVWSDERTAAASADTLDLRGGLTSALGAAALAFVEVTTIAIWNKGTAASDILAVGAGSNPAFAGLFAATGDAIKVPAGGMFLWHAPLDGGGLSTTAGTADILTIDPGARTVTYQILIIGRSA